jgi:hypothetical protein
MMIQFVCHLLRHHRRYHRRYRHHLPPLSNPLRILSMLLSATIRYQYKIPNRQWWYSIHFVPDWDWLGDLLWSIVWA